MSLEYILTILAVFGFGILSSGGVFTVFVSVGLVPRFADKTHTGVHIIFYENCIVAGSIAGCLLSVYPSFFQKVIAGFGNAYVPEWGTWGRILLAVFGVFAGMFVGCFAIAIAEMLNTIPIFTRRIRLGHGVGIVILAVALGKTAGALYYFYERIGKW